jgi:tol-pal system protein YbgF
MRLRDLLRVRGYAAYPFILSVLIGTGCATRQQAVEIESSMAEVKEQNEKTSKDVASLRDAVLAEHDLIMNTKADILAQISTLKEQISMMENRLTEAKSEVPFAPEGEGKIEEGEITPPSSPGGGEGKKAGSGPGVEARQETSGKVEGGSQSERIAYDTAFLDMTRGNYKLAIDGFRSFIENNGSSQLMDNAQYWIGECYYALGDLHKAIEEFERVVDNYPRGNKIPSALFKIGKCYYEQGDMKAARKYFQSVVDGYPSSDEAHLAGDYLSEM